MERIKELILIYKLPIAVSLIGIMLIIGGIISSSPQNKPQKTSYQTSPKETQKTNSEIKVDISGAVKNPGVYSFSSNSRIEDAIRSAGGFTESVDQLYISKNLNLSQKLTDGTKIYIPSKGESPAVIGLGNVAVAGVTTVSTLSKIGVNSATQPQLENLPGIGPVTAQKIIQNRPYDSMESLMIKKAITRSIYEKIKDQIDLN